MKGSGTKQKESVMKIRISEVWNGGSDGSKELAVIEASPSTAKQDVYSWVSANRPDLHLCSSVTDHGFHAIAI